MSLIGNGKTKVISDMLKANIPSNLMSSDVKKKFVNQILNTVIQLKGNPVNLDVATKAVSKINFKDIYGKRFPLIRENLNELKSIVAKTVVKLLENDNFMKYINEDDDEEEDIEKKKFGKHLPDDEEEEEIIKKKDKSEDDEEEENKEDKNEEEENKKDDEDLDLPEFSVEKVKEILSDQDMEEFSEYLVKLVKTAKELEDKLNAEKEKTAEGLYNVSKVEDEKEKMKENFEKRIDTISTIVALKTLKEAKKQLMNNSEVSTEVKVLEKIRESMDSAYASLLKEIEELKTENDKLKAVLKLKESITKKILKKDKDTKEIPMVKEGKEDREVLVNKLRQKLHERISEDKDNIKNRKNLIESRKKKLESEMINKGKEDKIDKHSQTITEENEIKEKTLKNLDTLLD